jgi:predicted alpha/beta superfamily hydrolase
MLNSAIDLRSHSQRRPDTLFSPLHVERFPTSGGAEKFHKFIADELIPFMNNNYRISAYSSIMGHSVGGTFITWSLLTQPGLFNGYIAINPDLHYGDSYVIKMAAINLQKRHKEQKSYFMTVGNEPCYFKPLSEFPSLVEEKSGESIRFGYL